MEQAALAGGAGSGKGGTVNVHISKPVGERPFDAVVGKVLALARLQELLAWGRSNSL